MAEEWPGHTGRRRCRRALTPHCSPSRDRAHRPPSPSPRDQGTLLPSSPRVPTLSRPPPLPLRELLWARVAWAQDRPFPIPPPQPRARAHRILKEQRPWSSTQLSSPPWCCLLGLPMPQLPWPRPGVHTGGAPQVVAAAAPLPRMQLPLLAGASRPPPTRSVHGQPREWKPPPLCTRELQPLHQRPSLLMPSPPP